MSRLTDLALDYERARTGIEIDRLAELMHIDRYSFIRLESSKIGRISIMIDEASKRNASGLQGNLNDEEWDSLIGRLSTGTYMPEGVSEGLALAMRERINQRVIHYQDLLSADGSFEIWKDVLKARYGSGEEYSKSLEPLVTSDKDFLPFEKELLEKRGGISQDLIDKNPITLQYGALVHSISQIRELVFNN